MGMGRSLQLFPPLFLTGVGKSTAAFALSGFDELGDKSSNGAPPLLGSFLRLP